MYQINMYLETSIRGVRATTGWYGYILEYIDKLGNPHIIEDYDREIDITPNQLGLMVFLEALDRVNKDSEITVYSDSAYLRSGYTRYLQDWKLPIIIILCTGILNLRTLLFPEKEK